MRVLHLSTNDTAGGAARAAYRLHTGLTRLGHASRMLVLRKSGNDPAVAAFAPPGGFFARRRRQRRRRRIVADLARYVPTRPGGYELFSDARTEHGADPVAQFPPADVINLHWVAGFLDYEAFAPRLARLPRHVPIVWRLADMNPLTGGCHYDDGCGRFTDECGACPQLGSRDENDLSRQTWRRKRAALTKLGPGRLHVVGTSRWIVREAQNSSLLRDVPSTVIPNGLDVEEFAPRDPVFSRDLWGIPRDASVILFAAETLEVRRKGFACLLEALRDGLPGVYKPFLVSVGSLKSEIDLPVPHKNLGRINHDRLLSTAYSAADVFVMPSLQESFGQTVTESLACGTPVVAFASGGIVDMVRPDRTGWLAPTGDVGSLRRRIVTALTDGPTLDAMGEECRRVAVREYSLDVQARAYLQLYETLIEAAGGGNAGTPPARATAPAHGSPVQPAGAR